MKKTLLISGLLLGSLFTTNAQTVVWSDNFDDEDISDWTTIDADGDGFNWGDLFTVNDEDNVPVTPVSLISRSWQGDPLTPNNWVISPMINLSSYVSGSSTITLTWKVQAAAQTWSLERYTVYAATTNTTAGFLASPIKFTEIYPGGITGASLTKTLNLSSFAGQNIYIAFRHHDCTDQDFLSIDDVTVTATSLSTSDFFASNFAVYPNPSNGLVNLASKNNMAINAIQITDLNGRVVRNINTNGVSETQINISDLTTGLYFLNVQTDSGSGTTKIVKN